MKRAVSTVLGAAVAMTGVQLLGDPVVPAHAADAGVALAGFRDLVVDEAHGRVFVAQGTDRLRVADLDIATAQNVTLPGPAEALALSEDGSVLYVLVEGASQLVSVDPTTLAVAVVAGEISPCARTIEAARGVVWVGAHCADDKSLRAVDPATGAVTEVSTLAADVLIRVGAGHLVASELPRSAYADSYIREYAVTVDGEPSAELTAERASSEYEAFATTPDQSVVLAAARDDRLRRWLVPGLGLHPDNNGDLGYELTGSPAVAVRGDGIIATTSRQSGSVWFMNADGSKAYGWQGVGRYSYVYPGGLAFGSDLLYVAANGVYGEPDRLLAIEPRYRSDVRIADFGQSRAVKYGAPVVVRGRLESASENRTVLLYALEETGRRLVATTEADADGYYTAEIVARRNMRVRAVYEGDEETAPSRDTTDNVLNVLALVESEMTGERNRAGGVYIYDVRDRAVIKVRVRPVEPNRCVGFILKVRVDGRWRSVDTRCAHRDDSGRVKASIAGSRDYAGLLWRIKATSGNDTASSFFNTGPTHEFRFVR